MQFSVEIPSNKITQNLVQHGIELKSFGVTFKIKRSCGQRFIILKYDHESDSSDGSLLWVELAVTAVTSYLAMLYLCGLQTVTAVWADLRRFVQGLTAD